MSRDVDRATIVDVANNGKHCSTSVSRNFAKITSMSFADFLHQHANAFASLRLSCVAGAGSDASILP
jgi:hypothetical protein